MNTTTTITHGTSQGDAAIVEILLVTDGQLSFDPDTYFGLGVLVDILRASPAPGVKITTAHRGNRGRTTGDRPIVADLFDFRFDRHDLNQYDQVWLFGDSPSRYRDGFIADTELAALARFMDAGGGVFATGDHEDLGMHMCGRLPRVGSMRKWYFDADRPVGAPRAPEKTGPNRHDTLVAGDRSGSPGGHPPFMFADESDDRPQKLLLKWYDQGGAAIADTVRPHPLLSGPRGLPIDVLPDHPHEGECVVPADLTRSFEFPCYRGAEYPEYRGRRTAPEVIALSTVIGGHATRLFGQESKPNVRGRLFGAIGAYDGHRAGVGRVVVDATWHHFMNWNLHGGRGVERYPFPAQRAGFRHSEAGRAALAQIEAYFRNIAAWLTPAPRRPALLHSLLAGMAWSFPAIEFLSTRPLANMSFAELVHAGEASFGALSATIGDGQAILCVLDLLAEVEGFAIARFPGLDPWADPTPEASDAPPAAWLLASQARYAVLGGALQRLVDDHPARPETPLDASTIAASLRTGVILALDKLYAELERSSHSLQGQAMALRDSASAPLAAGAPLAAEATMDWRGLTRHYIDLALPLIFIRGSKGVLACGYFDPRTFDHPRGPMAGVVVRGVATCESMLTAKVAEGDISQQAQRLGILAGMTGRDALERLR